jgi:hypothetical protein
MFESAQKGMPRNFIGGSITCCKVDIRTTGKDISQLKRKLKYIMVIGGSITCCKVDISTTGKDISQLKRKLKYIMGYPRIYVKFFHRWVKKR